MKKIVSLALVLLLCLGMTLTASATTFVPSIEFKDNPMLVRAIMNGEDVTECIVITTIQEALDKTTDITQEESDLLLKKYEDIKNGEVLPIDGEYVVFHLVDINFRYNDCRQQDSHGEKDVELAKPETTITLTLDLGIDAYTDIEIVKFYEGAWEHVTEIVNNGDGTITATFEHFCPNAFVVKTSQNSSVADGATGGTPETGDDNGAQLVLWGGVFGACVIGLIAVVVVYSKKRRHA